mgnify:CR=1 FL=1
MNTRLRSVIEQELQVSQIAAENRFLKQLVFKYETVIQTLKQKLNSVELKLEELQHFEDLRKKYLRNIRYLQKAIEQKNDELLLLKKELSNVQQRNKELTEYFNSLATKLRDLKTGKEQVYLERDIAYLNRNYYNELEATAVKYEKLRSKQPLFDKQSIDIVLKETDELLKRLEEEE